VWKLRLLLIICLLITAMIPTSLAQAAPSPQSESVRDLWLDVSLGPPLVDWFNRVGRPDDIARVENFRQMDLLDDVTAGRKLVVFKSITEAQRVVPEIADEIDIIGYNLENGRGYSPRERADALTSVKHMHDLAREFDLLLAFGPDHNLAISEGVAVAPYVDLFILQVQRVQSEPETVSEFVLPLIPELREANPDLEVSVQVRTEGDIVELVDLIDAMNDQLDGVSILTSPETIDTAEALVAELQTRKDTTPYTSLTTTDPDEVAVETRAATPPSGENSSDAGLSCPLMVVGAFVAGGLGGGVTAALICASRSRGADESSDQL
jgi:hypothetical protein